MYGAIAIKERRVPPDPVEATRLLGDAYVRRGPTPDDTALLSRLAFAGIVADFETVARASVVGAKRLDDVSMENGLDDEARRRLTRDAPATVTLSNGERLRVEYRADGRPIVSVRVQKVFGVTETPRVGPRQVPVTFELLAPNGRPVQVTSDLASFWTKVYPEIRGPLKARYPKHRW
jgi:ATP-dependent helicase HrpB